MPTQYGSNQQNNDSQKFLKDIYQSPNKAIKPPMIQFNSNIQ